MSKIRSLPRFCIALSAAVLLTGGLASANDDNLPNHWGNHSNLHSGFFAELNKLASPFKALAEHIRKEEERKARLEEEERDIRQWLANIAEEIAWEIAWEEQQKQRK
ncbi:MAG: hypothetical protein GDA41_05165 [Rhodospirillales bacterium]|nr:hypothetical protein [Rhodospirillales bacterium]